MPRPQKAHAEPMWLISQAKFWPKKAGPRGSRVKDEVRQERHRGDQVHPRHAVGDISRFRNSKRVVAYLGLDPGVRQSGETPARSGSISKRGSVSARWALVEATWSVVHQPRPLRAFYLRARARRGHGKAIVATARGHPLPR
jgi:transposase